MISDKLKWITPEWSAPPNIRALTTCRQGGVSAAPYKGFNLAEHVEDDFSAVAQNRAILKAQAALPENPRWLNQVHSINVVDGASLAMHQPPPLADASYSHAPKIVCGVLTADCLPLLVCDKAGTWVAAIHAGWRGLAMGVIDATLQHYPETARDQLLIWLGPAIGPSAFRVSYDVVEQFDNQGFQISETVFKPLSEPDQFLGNLYALARQRLQSLGILPQNITGGTLCTYSQATDFYSYRRDGITGRMASLIWRI